METAQILAESSKFSMNELLLYAAAIVFFLLISGFFSASETALTALSRARIFQLVKDGNRQAQKVSRLRKNKESFIGAVLIGNNVVNAAASTVSTSLFIQLFGDNSEVLIGVTLFIAVLIIIFSEILPKTYAIQNAERVSMAVATPIALVVRLFSPITATIQFFIRSALRIFGVDITKNNTLISATDVIRGTIELHHREGQMVKQDRDMLGGILDLNDIEVCDIMVHRTHVDTIDASLPAEAILEKAVSMLHSRVPLWQGNSDNIIGILHVKDLIRTLNTRRHEQLTREEILSLAHAPWFIPETTSLRDQLLAFRARRQHFAVVVDEYGAYLGIVTLEDIIEEIVGNIDDEHDEAGGGQLQRVSDNVYYAAGSVTIRDINRELDWNLPDEHASTLAGLMMHEARDIPARGEHVDFNGFRFTVIDKNARAIRRIKLERLTPESSEFGEEN